MAEQAYNYSEAADFPGAKCSEGNLAVEIQAAANSGDITTALLRVQRNPDGDDVDKIAIVFAAPLSAGEETALDGDTTGPAGGLIAQHNAAIVIPSAFPAELTNVKLNEYNHMAVAASLGIGGGFRIVTHNYCDKCSWWQESTDHVDQATTTGDDLVFDITGHDFLVDLRHGRVFLEDQIDETEVAPNGNTMSNLVPTVSIDSTPLAQSLEDHATDPDRYTIDYEAGTVTFGVARGGGDVVEVSFRKAGSSKYTLCPADAKKYVLTDAEIDVTENVDMVAAFMTNTYGSHTTLTGGNVVVLNSKVYKTFHDFQAAARRFWGPIPADFGGTGGVSSPKWTFEWQYSRSDELFATPNYRDLNIDAALITLNKVELSVVGDVPLGGDFLTMAFYGHEASETNG